MAPRQDRGGGRRSAASGESEGSGRPAGEHLKEALEKAATLFSDVLPPKGKREEKESLKDKAEATGAAAAVPALGPAASERAGAKTRAWFNAYVHHCRRSTCMGREAGSEARREREVGDAGGGAVSGGSASSTALCLPGPGPSLPEGDPLRSLELSFLSLSGVDDSVSPRTLCDISQEFSFVEWGVNFRAEKQGKEARYASLTWLRQLQEEIDQRQQTGKFAPIHFAAHLGGEYCVDVLKGDTSLVRTLWEDYGFLRIHLCPTRAHGVNSSQLKKYLASLKSVIVALPQVEFVLLVCKETRALAFHLMNDCQPNLAFFYHADEVVPTGPPPKAGAAATLPKRPPPCPHPGIHCGYGGGLTVENLTDELRRIAQVVNCTRRPIWVDLEAGLRSSTGPGRPDEFDLGKAWACIRTVSDLDLPRPRPTFASR